MHMQVDVLLSLNLTLLMSKLEAVRGLIKLFLIHFVLLHCFDNSCEIIYDSVLFLGRQIGIRYISHFVLNSQSPRVFKRQNRKWSRGKSVTCEAPGPACH